MYVSCLHLFIGSFILFYTTETWQTKAGSVFFQKKMLDPEMPTWSFNCYNTRDGCPFLMDMQCFALIFKSPEII